ncbi:hypothetical protein CEXT_628771 [Caerostris extrusa]|uniref:Uncharacterized protein n=1 Tax=Caerostris extrusa TaxID=172846 RepID=A0AAV4U766_CAEEX|nr:hypothetical protein CEXT_628771 [Caerostris extrusa]
MLSGAPSTYPIDVDWSRRFGGTEHPDPCGTADFMSAVNGIRVTGHFLNQHRFVVVVFPPFPAVERSAGACERKCNIQVTHHRHFHIAICSLSTASPDTLFRKLSFTFRAAIDELLA